MARKKRRIGRAGRTAIAHIRANPGTSILGVDKAVRTARGGHQWMYRTVHRLIKNGAVLATKSKGKYVLEINPEADDLD
jgi:hypothetical protein